MGISVAQFEKMLEGRVLCPNCGAALLASSRQCSHCGQGDLTAPAAAAASTPERPTIFEVIVYGDPVTQGSMTHKGGGRMAHKDGVKPWRQKIEDAFRELYETPDWEPITAAVRGDLVVTVGHSSKDYPRQRATYPTKHNSGDLDKYERAVNDAVSPKAAEKKAGGKLNLITEGPNRHRPHFRLLNDDSQVVEWGTGPVKTFPRPQHTHPGALEEPGVRVRFTVLDEPAALMEF